MLQLGDKAPDFTLPDQSSGTVTLTSLLARGPLLLYFYPADFTPICTREACLFRDAYDDLAETGIQIAGISADGPGTHARFAQSLGLRQLLLADRDKAVIRAYGALGPLGVIRRVTYLIGTDGLVQAAVRADLRLARHDALIKAVRKLGSSA